ncbi:tail protein [Cronobacter phage Dev-CD-23823]|uniref:Tail tubular protein A n=1 Tax=Cronobacter phage Dev-CD-23823 TaxID=1712539 RepID=A0A0K8IXP0_9CAUD|nr:tail protein [Cronobacter phage Dev-CD-23823]CUH74611.1 Tail tubular protein A [Cronobacter phage Dev-CD-23823]
MFTELDVVNACLATLGELPLVELTDEHPMVAAARTNLVEAMVSEMHRQWWFNTDYVVLSATEEGFIYAPADAVAVKVEGCHNITLRGRRLYDRYRSSYEFSGSFSAMVIRNIPFDDLPAPAQILVKDSAVLQFQINYDADQVKTSQLQQKYSNSYRLLNAEHARQIAANQLENPGVAMARMNAGIRPRKRRPHGHIPTR